LGYLHATHLGLDPVVVICRGDDGSSKHDRPSSPHSGTCDPCALACNETCAGIVTPDAKFSITPSDRLVGTPTAWVEAVSLPARHTRTHPARPLDTGNQTMRPTSFARCEPHCSGYRHRACP
jgi:hypothetical protein